MDCKRFSIKIYWQTGQVPLITVMNLQNLRRVFN